MRNLKVIEAIEALSEYIQNDSQCYEAYYYRARLLTREKNIKEAIEDYDKCIQISPNSYDPYYYKAELYLNNKGYVTTEVIIETLEELIILDQNNGYAHHKKAVLLVELNKCNEALLVCKRAIECDPTKMLDAYQAQVSVYEALRGNEILLCGAYVSLGRVLVEDNKFKEAIDILDKAINSNPNDLILPYQLKIEAIIKLGQDKEYLIDQLEQVIIAKPEIMRFCEEKMQTINSSFITSETYIIKGLIFHHLTNYTDSIKAYKKAIKQLKDEINYYKTDQPTKQPTKMYQTLADAYNNKGNALFALSRQHKKNIEKMDQAFNCYNKAIKLCPDNTLYHSNKEELENLKNRTLAIKEQINIEYPDYSLQKKAEYLKHAIDQRLDSIEQELNNKVNKTLLEPHVFKVSEEILSNPKLNEYYSALFNKLTSVTHEAEIIASTDSLALDTSNTGVKFFSAVLSLVPVVGKYLSPTLNVVSELYKAHEIRTKAIEFTKLLGSTPYVRESVLKKIAENATLNKRGNIENIDKNPEVLHWKDKGLINTCKDFVIVNVDDAACNNDIQLLGCIDALKVIHKISTKQIDHRFVQKEIIEQLSKAIISLPSMFQTSISTPSLVNIFNQIDINTIPENNDASRLGEDDNTNYDYS
ncbi:MAG TPA: tetratricopeptide repeat protein [Rickettsia endosymbiont of Bembidion lapponicum]|nr:tetratricopeptide repeat protein [Rickettsia endosymbiont of Bembidion lapponicum]